MEALVANEAIYILHQPAVRIDRGRIEFMEALARFAAEPYRTPDQWFDAAATVGLELDLELLALRKALSTLARIPTEVALSVNLSPAAAASDEVCDLLDGAPLKRLIVELTEHRPVECYAALLAPLAPLRRRGLRIAIDDTGAGYASFRHILELQPDIIKLDKCLCRGVDRDPAKQALLASLRNFSIAVRCDLVAEGIEQAADLDSLRRIGIPIVQGHFVGRPMPAVKRPAGGLSANETRRHREAEKQQEAH